MEANPTTIDASVYYHFAGDNLSRWLAIKGQRVSHCTFGEGTILKTIPSRNSKSLPTLWVRFDQPVESAGRGRTNTIPFSLIALRDKKIISLTLPHDLLDAVTAFEQLKRAEEEQARNREQEEQETARRRAEEERRQREQEAEARQTFQRLNVFDN